MFTQNPRCNIVNDAPGGKTPNFSRTFWISWEMKNIRYFPILGKLKKDPDALALIALDYLLKLYLPTKTQSFLTWRTQL